MWQLPRAAQDMRGFTLDDWEEEHGRVSMDWTQTKGKYGGQGVLLSSACVHLSFGGDDIFLKQISVCDDNGWVQRRSYGHTIETEEGDS